MKISVIGTGYVGLVTGVCLAEIGHHVTCIDVDPDKVYRLRSGDPIIYEPGLGELIRKNLEEGRLTFTDNYSKGLLDVQVIYIAVGTPSNSDGTADLTAIEQAATMIADHLKNYTVIVTKSTVPIGTNHKIQEIIQNRIQNGVTFDIVSNPEFLREGTAVKDMFFGDRIIIGADNKKAADIVEDVIKPFNIPVFRTTIRSAEMIKYASNAFLATKISFINEIANLCEKLDADITEVAKGMGMDKRIGSQFLKAGIGYGGSCFPKDTNALVQIAGDIDHEFTLLKSVIEVNKKQQRLLIDKAVQRFGSLKELKVAVLGLSFKPNTDDIREAPSIPIISSLLSQGARVVAYDPVAQRHAKRILPSEVGYANTIHEAIQGANCAFILTEWSEIVEFNLSEYELYMKDPILFDGRNCYDLIKAAKYNLEYYSVGRTSVRNGQKLFLSTANGSMGKR